MPHDKVLTRIRSEYLEMPGLRLKPEEVQRLCGVERATCQRVLDTLVEAHFLDVNSSGAYGRIDIRARRRPAAGRSGVGGKAS